MAALISTPDDSKFVYHVLRYTSDLIRDEWVNIGVILFDPLTGALRLRLVEDQDEYARIRRLQPAADQDVLRGFRDHLEDRFAAFLRNRRAEQDGTPPVGQELQKLMENWNQTLLQRTAVGAAKGSVRGGPGCRAGTALRGARRSTAQGRTCRRSRQSRDDSWLLRASLEGGRTLGPNPKVGARNGVYLPRGPHADRLLLPPKRHARLCANAQRFPHPRGLQAFRVHRGSHCRS